MAKWGKYWGKVGKTTNKGGRIRRRGIRRGRGGAIQRRGEIAAGLDDTGKPGLGEKRRGAAGLEG